MARGQITTMHTVWCGRCAEWADLTNVTVAKPPAKAARELGFKVNREFKWLCPACLSTLGIAPPPESLLSNASDEMKTLEELQNGC